MIAVINDVNYYAFKTILGTGFATGTATGFASLSGAVTLAFGNSTLLSAGLGYENYGPGPGNFLDIFPGSLVANSGNTSAHLDIDANGAATGYGAGTVTGPSNAFYAAQTREDPALAEVLRKALDPFRAAVMTHTRRTGTRLRCLYRGHPAGGWVPTPRRLFGAPLHAREWVAPASRTRRGTNGGGCSFCGRSRRSIVGGEAERPGVRRHVGQRHPVDSCPSLWRRRITRRVTGNDVLRVGVPRNDVIRRGCPVPPCFRGDLVHSTVVIFEGAEQVGGRRTSRRRVQRCACRHARRRADDEREGERGGPELVCHDVSCV